MFNIRSGAVRLFRLAGVDVYLHWSWFVIALFEVQSWESRYGSVKWAVLEYLALFGIVLLHEFGHAMACRQVGGTANQIVLWPLGGVAYVRPPQRPGAMLWSIAAGPLVNVALIPVTVGALAMARGAGWPDGMPDAYAFLRVVAWTNTILLLFNILPFYPLDGGQIFRSLLWFVLGRARSLMVATVVGLVGIAGFIGLALWQRSLWTAAIAGFMLLNCWNGLKHARALLEIAKLERRPGFKCPSCRTAPPLGGYWQCGACGQRFDTFATGSVCPMCGARHETTTCLDCQERAGMGEWERQGLGTR